MLEWNVFYHDVNKKEIRTLNIFNHVTFRHKVEQLLDEYTDGKSFVKFNEELKVLARMYFWAKCEYEVVITSWPPRITEEELNRLNNEEKAYRYNPDLEVGKKVDIFNQLHLNWDKFAKYIWTAGCINE